jgi:murein DD-endopeptidase MepM/ murein hydrolase activator NlpD
MNPFERWDDWEWERAAQEIGRDQRGYDRDNQRERRYYFEGGGPSKDFLEILNGSQKRVILSALLFLTIVFSSRGEDFLSQHVYSFYRTGMDSGNLYTALNSMAKEAMGIPGGDSMAVNAQVQGIFYPPVAGAVKVGFERKSFDGGISSGIEIESSLGTPVLCPQEGVVLDVSINESLGKMIKINFGNGWTGIIGNLGEVHVQQGDPVSMGLKLGTVGLSSTRQKPWLYLEIQKNSKPVNPIPYLIQNK